MPQGPPAPLASMKRLYKKQKLCSRVAIDMLFASSPGTHRALAFPLRAVWRDNPGRRSDAPVQMLISIPKKRLRHAVDRVKMRRRVREAFRLNHQDFPMPQGARIDMVFVYVSSSLESYDVAEHAMRRLLEKAAASIAAERSHSEDVIVADPSTQSPEP